jgi:hypothetical protein
MARHLLTVLTLAFGVSALPAADLAAIKRFIAKEPVYQPFSSAL